VCYDVLIGIRFDYLTVLWVSYFVFYSLLLPPSLPPIANDRTNHRAVRNKVNKRDEINSESSRQRFRGTALWFIQLRNAAGYDDDDTFVSRAKIFARRF
jgi:hypothetical protein